MSPYVTVPLILTILGGLMLGLRFYQRRYSPHPEVVRKLLHVPMGLMTLSFPWLFNSPIPVIVLASLAIGWLLLLRWHRGLRAELGDVLGGVGRRSLGEVYFPVSVALLFTLSQGDPLLFCLPMLILTLADAIAAVIGVRYGQVRYTTTDGHKSAEGSLAFFMAAFFSVHVPLLLLSETGRTETLLIALILGLLAMLLEAIAWQGLDNLFIPLGGFVLLRSHLAMSVSDLSVRLGVTLVLVVLVLSWRKRTTLTDSALLGAAFMGYLSWTLGGWRWLLPPLILLIAYPRFVSWIDQVKNPLTQQEQQVMRWLPADPASPPRQWQRIHDIHSVLSVCAAGLLWLLLFGAIDRPDFRPDFRSDLLFPYTLAFASNLAVIGVAGFSPLQYWRSTQWLRLLGYSTASWLLMFLPIVLVTGSRLALLSALAGWLGTALSAAAYYLIQPTLRQQPTDRLAWICRSLITTAGSLVGLLPIGFG